MEIDYSKSETPQDYKCGECGATGCKLWRSFGNWVSPELLCAKCAEARAKETGLDLEGERSGEFGGSAIDDMGDYVPAILEESGNGFLSAIEPAQDAYDWWEGLPSSVDVSV